MCRVYFDRRNKAQIYRTERRMNDFAKRMRIHAKTLHVFFEEIEDVNVNVLLLMNTF